MNLLTIQNQTKVNVSCLQECSVLKNKDYMYRKLYLYLKFSNVKWF